MAHRVLVAVVVAMLMAALPAPGISDSLDISLEFASAGPSRSIKSTVQSAGAAERIEVPGFGSYTSSGNPALPCKLIYVALPPNADEESVRIDLGSYSTTVLDGVYNIAPVPPAATSSAEAIWGLGKEIVGSRNARVYKADQFYPSRHLRVVSVGRLRTWKVAVLEFWPYCYNPVSRKMRAIESNHVSIGFDVESLSKKPIRDPVAVDMAGCLVNADQARQWYGAVSSERHALASTEPPATGYAIITTSAIAAASSALSDFAVFKAREGFNVRIVTESEWGGGFGDAAAENIRRWLAANYLDLGIEYVLLIGNPCPATGDVPMKLLWPEFSPVYPDAASDYYYAELTSNWDRDGDGYCGEMYDDFGQGGIDRIPEVCVGRIPVYDSVADLDHILRKTIAYESGSVGDWSHRFILSMKPLDSCTPSYQLGEEIKSDMAVPLGFSPVRIYDGAYGLMPPPEHWPCGCDAVQSEWANGAGLVFWMTHGSATDASSIFNSDMCAGLDDTKPSIVYAASCYNGDPDNPRNLAYSLLRQGAVCALAASRVSWYYIGESDFRASDSIGGLGYRYADFLLRRQESCGQAAMDARLSVPMFIWPNHLVFNIYGDPSLTFNRSAFGAISGKVLALDGSPISDAVIRTVDSARSTTSGPDGSYSLGGLQPGSQDIIVSAEGFYPQSFYSVPVALNKTTRLDFRLAPAVCGSIAGYVHDTYGVPVYDAVISTIDGRMTTHTLYDGSFSLDKLVPGTYTIVVSAFPNAQAVVADCVVVAARTTEVNVVVRGRTANAVINGGFEEGFSGQLANRWKSYSSPGCHGGPIVGSDYFKFGSFSQKLDMQHSDSEGCVGICQVVKVMPGRTHTLVAWQRHHFDGKGADSAVCRFGYDPMGGSDYTSPTIVWEEFGRANDVWQGIFKSVYSYADEITIFLEAHCKALGNGADCFAWFDGVSLMGPVIAPSVPTVKVDNRYQSDTTSIRANWSSSDSDVVEYQCAVSATADESGIVPGGEWASVGMCTSVTRSGLALRVGDVVRVLVRARNGIGITSEVSVSEPVRIVLDVDHLSSAKRLTDGTWVRVHNVLVGRMGQGPECFVEDTGRTAGIRVTGTWNLMPFLQSGTVTTVVGRLATVDNVRVLSEAEMMPSIVGAAVAPLGMQGRWVGGGNYFYTLGPPVSGQIGSRGGRGLNTVGLLVRVWGHVTKISESEFTISDGSLRRGLEVKCFNGAASPPMGAYVVVTGIAMTRGVSVYAPEDVQVIIRAGTP